MEQQKFDAWYELESRAGTSWFNNLPKCPTQLCMVDDKPQNPDPEKWENPQEAPGAEKSLHPGAVLSMRSKSFGGHSNQCTYTDWGELIRRSTAAGTADFKSPGQGLAHYEHDVAPIWLANSLDGGARGNLISLAISQTPFGPSATISATPGHNVQRYLEVRPLWAKSEQ